MALQPPARHIFRMIHRNFWINVPLLRHCCNGKGRPGEVENARGMSSVSSAAAVARPPIPPEIVIPPPTMLKKKILFHRKTKRHRSRPCIGTLTPSQMSPKEQKIFDMSGRMPFHFSVSGSDRLPFHIYYYIHPRERFSSQPFPANTRGVFYYYYRHDHPPVSGELRFRLCKSLEQFDEGQDLMLGDGPLPWNLSIYTLARDKKWEGLLSLLLEERLVDEELVHDMKNIRMQRPQGQYPWISMLDQPFIVDLAKPDLNVALLTRHEFRLLRFQNIFWDADKGLSPYTGRILARFEFSNHLRHMKRTSIVIRILQILTPIECTISEYDGKVGPPIPGTLFSTKSRHGIGYIAWAVPVDGGHGDGANKAPLPRFLDSLKEEGFTPPQPKFYVDLDDTPLDVKSQSES